jgi:uncharacterized protein YjbJ (UPF0337 family)
MGIKIAAFDSNVFLHHREAVVMDKDRIIGSAKQAEGAIKEFVGKAAGDTKLQSRGATEKSAGKIQNAIGGLNDTVRDILKTP